MLVYLGAVQVRAGALHACFCQHGNPDLIPIAASVLQYTSTTVSSVWSSKRPSLWVIAPWLLGEY